VFSIVEDSGWAYGGSVTDYILTELNDSPSSKILLRVNEVVLKMLRGEYLGDYKWNFQCR
jgi:hypothetical protein